MPTRTIEHYAGGQLIGTDTYEISDLDVERDEAPDRIRKAIGALGTWADQAEAVSNQGTNVTQAQLKILFNRFGIVCRLVRADLIREFDPE